MGGGPWMSLAIPHLSLLFFKGCCACSWYATEFLLVDRAGAVATSAVANANRVCSVAVSLAIFGNAVTPVQLGGFALTLGGVGGLLYEKAQAAQNPRDDPGYSTTLAL